MSARPIEAKQRRRVAKGVRRQSLPTYFDLVRWLVDHGHAATPRLARKIIMQKRVRANSHTLGVKQLPVRDDMGNVKVEDVLVPFVPAELRSDVVVLDEAS